MPSRPDNLSVAGSPAQSVPAPAASTMISDTEWVAQRYLNFRLFVHSLAPQEPKLADWSDWLKTIPLGVFLAGGDCELKGMREASTDEKRAEEANLVLERFALEWDFDLGRITAADKLRLKRYLLLFAAV